MESAARSTLSQHLRAPDPFLHEIIAALISAPRIKDPAANLFVEALFNAACARILRNYAKIRYPLSGPPRLTDDQLRVAIDFINDHLRESLELRSISRAAGLSEFHFARLFKAATGVPAGHICIAYLPRQRFEPIMFSRFNQIRIDSRNKHFGSSPRSSEGNGGNKEGSAY